MPMLDREAYQELARLESFAFSDGEFVKDFGVAKLKIRKLSRAMFEYVWGDRVVEKAIALSAVRTFGERHR